MKKTVLALAISSILLFGIFVAANRTLRAETAGSDPEISRKLQAILNNQETIMAGIAELKQELYVIKIRVTQQQ